MVEGVCVEAVAGHGVVVTRREAAWWAPFNARGRCHARCRCTKHTPIDLQADDPNLHMCIMGVALCIGWDCVEKTGLAASECVTVLNRKQAKNASRLLPCFPTIVLFIAIPSPSAIRPVAHNRPQNHRIA